MRIEYVSTNNITLTFPDGNTRNYARGITAMDVARSLSKSLSKKVLAAKIDGILVDASYSIDRNAGLELVTKNDPEGLELIRHDAAHVLAEAVQELFPGTQVTIGPVIENGFYYDFARDEPFSDDDFAAIEKKMAFIIDRNDKFERVEVERGEAIKIFRELGECFKAELIEDLPELETITLYKQGKWFDLCRGPHLPSTGKIGKAFKLMKVAGAYWRGDSNKAQLQRIYGTAWASQEDLEAHLHMLAEAEARDHRKLGKQLELFHMQPEAQGMVFWHDKGATLWREVESYVRRQLKKANYLEVKTPLLINNKLWQKSGHWDKFRENMFVSEVSHGAHDEVHALKPMNCPAHVQVFNQGMKSYRDLPLRMAEFGCCHRNEPTGALHGIMRVRGFTQDDAHIFCTENQISEETGAFIDLLSRIYKDFGFTDLKVKFSDRPQVRAGDDSTWDKSEKALMDSVKAVGLEVELNPGEGAFYGPKLEFVLRDAIGRDWQCGTLQVDFVLPDRLQASYIGEDDKRHRPVMLHRAILGSMERFIGILIENYSGKLPLWLAPIQLSILTVTEEANEFAMTLKDQFDAINIRVELDNRNEKIGYKIREHSNAKVPLMAVIGKEEMAAGTVSIRNLRENETNTYSIDEAVELLRNSSRSPS